MTVRRDDNAYLLQVPGGCLTLGLGGYVELHAGRYVQRVPMKYQALLTVQSENPVHLGFDAERGRTWWMFEDRFYWEAEGYTADEVRALIVAADLRRERRLEQAIALTAQAGVATEPARPPIPEAVRIEVWRRDSGQCVRCGSQRNLEFDHIIPLALGGSNTARNIQLLCETCNREKGASLA
jgi:hypothetical protein